MDKGYTKLIVSKINLLKVGGVITSANFPNVPRASVVTILNRIAKKDENIERVKRGVFIKVKKTKYGLAKPTPLEILMHEIGHDDNKCFGGTFLFNQLGLTTQVPSTIEVLNNKSSYKIRVGNTTIRYSKIRPKIEKNNKACIALLEVIKKITSITDSNLQYTVRWLKKSIEDLTLPQLKQLVNTAYSYPPKTRAILGTLLSIQHPASAKKIKLTLKNNSYYTIGELSEYLFEPLKWGLKN